MKCDTSVHVYMGYDNDNDAVEFDDNYFKTTDNNSTQF